MDEIAPGFGLHTHSNEQSNFDFESDSKELWLCRVPHGVDVSKLNGMKIKLPIQTKKKKAARLGGIEGKDKEKFGIHLLPCEESSPSSSDQEEEEEGDVPPVGCHDMYGYDCLIPSRKKNGKLVLTPRSFSRHIAITELVDIPNPTQAALEILSKPYKPPEQPEGLKFQFRPYGFDTGVRKASKKRKREDLENVMIKSEVPEPKPTRKKKDTSKNKSRKKTRKE